MWKWTPPITIRMIPKPIGSMAPAKPEEGTLTQPDAIEPSHAPDAKDLPQ